MFALVLVREYCTKECDSVNSTTVLFALVLGASENRVSTHLLFAILLISIYYILHTLTPRMLHSLCHDLPPKNRRELLPRPLNSTCLYASASFVIRVLCKPALTSRFLGELCAMNMFWVLFSEPGFL